MKSASADPNEMIRCGKCNTVNAVPFGLDRFQCYTCGIAVNISRPPTAACAAVSTTAQAYETRKAPADTDGGTTAQGVSDTKKAETSSSSFGSTGIFGKLQKTMDKTMQKMEKQFEAFTGGKVQPAVAPPVRGDCISTEGAQRQAGATGDHSTMRSHEDSLLSVEDRQLQWALNASLAEAGRLPSAADNCSCEFSGAGSSSLAQAGDEEALEQAATQAAAHLQLVEERAHRAEQMLAQATVREAAIEAERLSLRRTLDEHEGLIKGLTEQLDVLNSELDLKKKHCEKLEADLEAVRLKREAENTEMEPDGTINQLLARIAELESTLLQATHFATDAGGPEAEASPAAFVANFSPERVPEEPLDIEHLQDPETALPFVHGADLQAAGELPECRGAKSGNEATQTLEAQLGEPEALGQTAGEQPPAGDAALAQAAQMPEAQLDEPDALQRSTGEKQGTGSEEVKAFDTIKRQSAEPEIVESSRGEGTGIKEVKELGSPETLRSAAGEREGSGSDEVNEAVRILETPLHEPDTVVNAPSDTQGPDYQNVEVVEKRTGGVVES